MKRILRKLLLSFGYYFGIFEITRLILSKNGFVPILLYHQILDDIETNTGKSSFYLLGTGISKSQFERQVAYLRKKYKIINLKEYIETKEKGENLAGLAVITFDDGFRNPGLDILKNYQIPATIFLIGDAFEKVCWSHKVCLLLDNAKVKNFTLDLTPGKKLHFFLGSSEEKRKVIFTIIRNLRSIQQYRRNDLIDKMREELQVEKEFKPEEVYFNENDIKELLEEGLSFGGHSTTHTDLTKLNYKNLLEEIECSQKLLMKLTGRKDTPFSIPLGYYDDRVISTIKEKGFFCNLTSDDGLNSKNEDIYRLKRIYVNTDSFPEFVYKVSGAEMAYQKFLKLISGILSFCQGK